MKMNFMILILLMIMLLFLKHPMSVGLNLILQTMNFTMIIYYSMNMSWFSYMLFIMMLGGLMILFIYMTSIASNEKFNFSLKIFIIMIILCIFMFFMMKNHFNEMNFYNQNMKFNNLIFIIKLFYNNSMFLTIFLISYLLITMIFSSYIINIFEGPIRKKN
uniref:NADH-ubiquinone oxidoreductase chain 6 n=1 Tax=Oncylocotis sp. PJ-2015 TaxID=1663423 RepID=A0A342D266_9HEMI|nr:NADH dehydrogenase subunit 6 [Oncylocotis sp. PJ-2015]